MEFAGLVKTVQRGQEKVKEYAPASVAQAFIAAVQRSGLDPFARQIYAAEIGGKWTILGAIDGFRAVAAASREYEGRTEIEFTADGVSWSSAWLSDGPPAAARVGIIRKGFRQPAITVVTWKEFGRTTGQWRTQPAHMLGIRALSHGLRDAFPQALGGIYTPEDFASGDGAAAIVEPTRDWLALIASATTAGEVEQIKTDLMASGEATDPIRSAWLAKKGEIERASENIVDAEVVGEVIADE
jgi:hypothetical protein